MRKAYFFVFYFILEFLVLQGIFIFPLAHKLRVLQPYFNPRAFPWQSGEQKILPYLFASGLVTAGVFLLWARRMVKR